MKPRVLAVGLAVLVPATIATILLSQHGAFGADKATSLLGKGLALVAGVRTATPATSAQSATMVAVPPATAQTAGCGAVPHQCGFPDATSSGVPPGTPLRTVPGQVKRGPGWYYDPKGWVEVYGDGTVLHGLSIRCDVNVTAADVTIRDVRVEVTGNYAGISLRHTANVTITHSDIFGPSAGRTRLATGIKDVFGDSTGLKITDNDIWYTATGIQLESGLVAGNYIHNPGYLRGDHINGITSNGGNRAQLTIAHNTVLIGRAQTDAISLFDEFGVQANRTISGNLLAGGGYTIYAGQTARRPASYNIKIVNNKISQVYYPEGGYYGAADRFNRKGQGNVWSGNTFTANSWADLGQRTAGSGQ